MMFRRFGKAKYGNKKVEHAGRTFDSRLEKALYDDLLLQQAAGILRDIKAQDCVYLTAARILYKADYSAFHIAEGITKWHEAKGFKTPVWGIKRRLWKFYGPGPLLVYEGSARNFRLTETIVPKGIVTIEERV